MNNLGTIDITDFYFNGYYLSSFDALVAGTSGFTEFSLVPSRTDNTGKGIGTDGEYLFRSVLNPRTFTIPVLFNDLSGDKLRNICGWLDTDTVKDFYFKNDTKKLKAKLDPSDLSVENFFSYYGKTNLKFIAYDPFFYEITPTTYTISGSSQVVFTNIGNKISFPNLAVTTGSACVVTISFYKNNVKYHEATLDGLNGTTNINSSLCTIKSPSGSSLLNLYSLVSGSKVFPYIETGSIKCIVSGSALTSVVLTPNFKWI